MHGLLAPAIMLMNKLSYAKKFGVISLTFFIPLLLLSYAIINQTYQTIQKTAVEQESLGVINDFLTITDEASMYRDIASVQVLLNNKEGLAHHAEKLESKLYKNIGKFLVKYKGTAIAAEVGKKTYLGWLKIDKQSFQTNTQLIIKP